MPQLVSGFSLKTSILITLLLSVQLLRGGARILGGQAVTTIQGFLGPVFARPTRPRLFIAFMGPCSNCCGYYAFNVFVAHLSHARVFELFELFLQRDSANY